MSTDLLPRLVRIGALAALVAVTCGFTYLYSPFTGLPVKWRSPTIPLHVQLGSDTTLSDGTNFSTSVQAAAEMWNAQLGDTRFDVTIDPAGSAVDDDGRNELAFGDGIYGLQFGYGVLAATTVLYDDEDVNRRIEADTIFNTAHAWDSYRGDPRSGTLDIRRVALHELGHNLGLDHPDDEGQVVTAIMNSQAGSQETLSADDITGAQNLYGPPGAPGNDAFANAIAITTAPDGTATVEGYNTNATRESDEPEHAGNPGGRSIWWKWTAPYSATVTVDTDGSYCDTLLAVYTGSNIGSLTLIAASDDIDPGIVQSSRVDFAATAGTTCYFAVDGFNAADGDGADSAAIRLHLGGEHPSITTQPANVSTTVGGSASFSVVAGGAGPLTYQWHFGGSPIEGATSATLTLTDVQSAQAGSYTVTISNAFGSVTSEAATLSLTSTPPPDDRGGSDGGGGAPSTWFLSALGVLALTRGLAGKIRSLRRTFATDAS